MKNENNIARVRVHMPTKYFVKIDSDSGGEMFTPSSVEVFDDFAHALERYRRLRLNEYISYQDEENEERMAEIARELDSIADADGVMASFEYENYDLDDSSTYVNLTVSLIKTSDYRTETKYVL